MPILPSLALIDPPKVQAFYHDFSRQHLRVILCKLRFIILVAGRRWGKTTVALFKLICHAATVQGQLCYFVAPSERQAMEIGWQRLKDLVPPELTRNVSESHLEISLTTGSTIKLHGPQGMRGTGLDYVAIDEAAYNEPELWPQVVRPMLADREGGALLASTPRGFNFFYDLYRDAKSKPDWATFHFASGDGGFISCNELALLQSSMHCQQYSQEIEAQFEAVEGRVYRCFSRDHHVGDIPLIPELPVLVGLDFNVGLMAAVVGQKVRDEFHVCTEVLLPNSGTAEMMTELSHRFPHRNGIIHPDPSGASRKTSAPVGETDLTIIRKFGWQVYHTKPLSVRDRINCVNSMFEDTTGKRRLFIDRKCVNLLKALDTLVYKAESNIPDKSSGLDHVTDALGYVIANVFPLVGRDTVSITQVLI